MRIVVATTRTGAATITLRAVIISPESRRIVMLSGPSSEISVTKAPVRMLLEPSRSAKVSIKVVGPPIIRTISSCPGIG